MYDGIKILVSLTLSGSILMLLYAFFCMLTRKAVSGKIRYYLWLLVIARFLIPVTFPHSVMNYLFAETAVTDSINEPQGGLIFAGDAVNIGDHVYFNPDNVISKEPQILPEITSQDSKSWYEPLTVMLKEYSMMIVAGWGIVAVALFVRRITTYQNFLKYIQSGWKQVDDPELLDILGEVCEILAIDKPVNLCVNPLVASPLLVGFRNPVIVLPLIPQDQKELFYILTHEMIHQKRKDTVYIWLTQLAVCIHWFNPLIYLMARKIERDREISCDEGVLGAVGYDKKKKYGYTLLNSFAMEGSYREYKTVMELFENKSALKERLEAIHSYQKPRKISYLGMLSAGFVFLYTGMSLGAYVPFTNISAKKEIVMDAPLESGSQEPETASMRARQASVASRKNQTTTSAADEDGGNNWLELRKKRIQNQQEE